MSLVKVIEAGICWAYRLRPVRIILRSTQFLRHAATNQGLGMTTVTSFTCLASPIIMVWPSIPSLKRKSYTVRLHIVYLGKALACVSPSPRSKSTSPMVPGKRVKSVADCLQRSPTAGEFCLEHLDESFECQVLSRTWCLGDPHLWQAM